MPPTPPHPPPPPPPNAPPPPPEKDDPDEKRIDGLLHRIRSGRRALTALHGKPDHLSHPQLVRLPACISDDDPLPVFPKWTPPHRRRVDNGGTPIDQMQGDRQPADRRAVNRVQGLETCAITQCRGTVGNRPVLSWS